MNEADGEEMGTERQEDDSDFGSSTDEGVVVSSDREAADNVAYCRQMYPRITGMVNGTSVGDAIFCSNSVL